MTEVADRTVVGRDIPGGTVVTPSGAIIRPDSGPFGAFSSLSGQYGVHGNAEALIEAHRSSLNPALAKSMLIDVDEEATKEANADLKAAGKKFDLPKGAVLLAASVRGNAIVGVVEYPDGTTRKLVAGWNDKYEPPRLTADQQAQVQAAEEHFRLQHELERLALEHASKLSDHTAELTAKFTDEVAKIRESAEKEIEKVREQAAKDAETGPAKRSPASRRPASRKRSSRKRSQPKAEAQTSASKTEAKSSGGSGSDS